MWYILIAILIIGGVLFGFKEKLFPTNDGSKANEIIHDGDSTIFYQDTIKPMYSKAEILKKLNKLAKTPPPEQLSFGAMCYSPAFSPIAADYVCPTCGEKTVYKGEYGIYATTINRTIPSCRSAIKNIKGINIALDESSFCKHCFKEEKPPELCLLVNIGNEKDTTIVQDINLSDIQLINEFLDGKLIHKGSHDEERPLVDYMDRIKQLLGIKD